MCTVPLPPGVNPIAVNKIYRYINVPHTQVVEKITTHILRPIIPPHPPTPPENCVVCEIIWKIRFSRLGHRWQYGACALNAWQLRLQTHSEQQKWLRERAPMLRYTCIPVLLILPMNITKSSQQVMDTHKKLSNLNKNPNSCNNMQIFIHCKTTLHVSGVTAPIIRSIKNCTRSLWYRS